MYIKTEPDKPKSDRKKMDYQMSLRLSPLAKFQLDKLCEISGENPQRVIARLINNEIVRQEKQD